MTCHLYVGLLDCKSKAKERGFVFLDCKNSAKAVMNITVCNCPFCVWRGVPMVDEWIGLADLLANLIEKYASDLDIDNLPDIEIKMSMGNRGEEVEKSRE